MTSQSTDTLQARYVEQAASDLEKNRRLQQELTEQLAQLKQDEGLLADILELAQRYEGFTDASRLPEQAQDEPAVANAKPAPAKSAPAKPAPAKSAPAGSGTKAGAKGKSPQPLLGELLLGLLAGHDEPCLARELRDELQEKHPSRNPTPQVVRNTLEALVAKGRVERHKQQRSVMYTAV